MAYVDAAIEDLQKSDLTSLSNQDLIYKGDASAWLKTAYGLKARYTMRLINRSTDKQADLNKVFGLCIKNLLLLRMTRLHTLSMMRIISTHSLVTSILALVLPIARA